MAWRTQHPLGRHRYQRSRCIICVADFSLRRIQLPPKPQRSLTIKYAEITHNHLFYPLAFETMGPINSVGLEFICDIGHRMSCITDDPRQTLFLFQCISVAIQRFNAVVFQTLSAPPWLPLTTPQTFRSTSIECDFLNKNLHSFLRSRK